MYVLVFLCVYFFLGKEEVRESRRENGKRRQKLIGNSRMGNTSSRPPATTPHSRSPTSIVRIARN